MKKRLKTDVELTLLELIISIGLLIFLAAVSLRIFVGAHRLSTQSETLGHAVIVAEDTVECIRAGIIPVIYYDGMWAPSDENNAVYFVDICASSANSTLYLYKISVSDINSEIFSLDVSLPKGCSP